MADQVNSAGDLFVNSWDEVLLCPTCKATLDAIAQVRANRLPAAALPLGGLGGFRTVYFIGSQDGPIKIGMAVMPEARLKELQTGHPYPLAILATVEGGQPQEAAYHRRFKAHRLHGEWFSRHPDILAEIERLNEKVPA